MKKARDLFLLAGLYLLAYLAGVLCGIPVSGTVLRYFVFDTVATVVIFVFSVLLRNSSVYDAYWSLTPMVMILWLYGETGAIEPFPVAFLTVFLLWSLRLTLNWVSVFTDFSYEDWRYRKYRQETPRLLWPVVNFFGIHYVPTVLVFLGMLPVFEIVKTPLSLRAVPGMAVMLAGILLELFADRQMHAFWKEQKGKEVCKVGLWRFSRHPNYLGEITFWTGVWLTMLPDVREKWFYGIGFLGIAVLFNVVSIPLMEGRQRERRPGYRDYCAETSRLLLLPVRRAGKRKE